jgi:hypothetical protein
VISWEAFTNEVIFIGLSITVMASPIGNPLKAKEKLMPSGY